MSSIKAAFTALIGDTLSSRSDSLFWDEVCSTFSDPLFASKLQSDEDDLGYQEKCKELERINQRLLVEKGTLVNNTRDLRADNTTLKKRVVFLESELARIAAASGQQGRANSSLQSELRLERKHREELQEEIKRYQQKLEESEGVIRMLTKQGHVMAFEEEGQKGSDGCGRIPERLIQQYHPFDEMWQLD